MFGTHFPLCNVKYQHRSRKKNIPLKYYAFCKDYEFSLFIWKKQVIYLGEMLPMGTKWDMWVSNWTSASLGEKTVLCKQSFGRCFLLNVCCSLKSEFYYIKMINISQNNWAQSHFPTTSSVTIVKNRYLIQGLQEGQEIIYLI